MFATVHSASLAGVTGQPVHVEVDVPATGFPSFAVVGLPDSACRELRDRVRAAVLNTAGLSWPDRRITVNVAPAGTRRLDPGFDLAVAVAVLAADGQVPFDAIHGRVAVFGELGLDGSVRPVRGLIPRVEAVTVTAAHPDVTVVAPVGQADEFDWCQVAGVTVGDLAGVAEVLACPV